MNLIENISLAINGLIANKMRALLTMLGIIIGIGSVIAITTVGNAMTTSVNNVLADFGITNIQVMLSSKDGGGSGGPMTKDDLITTEMISKYQKKFADKITAIGMSASGGTGKIKNGHKTSDVSISGVNEGSMLVDNITVIRGRFISEKDEQRSSNVAVISERLVTDLYGSGINPIGKQIRMETNYGYQTYTVIGVFEEASSSMFTRQDTRTTFYIPVTTAKELTGGDDGYQSLTVMATQGIDYTRFADDTQNYFNKFYEKNKFFQCFAISLEAEISEMNSMMDTLTLAISIIAAISLLVGGIGVMNIMLVSVTERTREIGVRKALGAPDSAIRTQFIVESMIICLIGGVLGIILGAGLGYAGGLLLKQTAVPTLSSIAVAVGFSMAIGIFFGYYPANKAAKLDPIEALRYE